jgi:hypothetical protein
MVGIRDINKGIIVADGNEYKVLFSDGQSVELRALDESIEPEKKRLLIPYHVFGSWCIRAIFGETEINN